MEPKPTGVRARARAEFVGEIKAAARSQLRTDGADSLSLRAVARQLGVASSALYRYFPSRDDLLTALISDAYGDLASAAERATVESAGKPFVERWVSLARAIRSWALKHRHEYALIYGSPVPGYVAPPETAQPARRLTSTWLSVLTDAAADGELLQHRFDAPPATAEALDVIRSLSQDATGRSSAAHPDGAELSDGQLRAATGVWTQMFGHLSFELFGQFQNVVADPEEFFDVQMREAGCRLAGPSASGDGRD
ncbi:MAG: TetR/AcrR family transcriptional regulator [Candidatus Microthrix subdominans]|nr:TetR/AcrR family transcriptional regulator [Candidatus Microthrix sp.]MBK9558781.1 TetR/AcrR family transcriptional regulator [Candidatus Microthrix sp.]